MNVQELITKLNNNGEFDFAQELEIKRYLPLEVKKTIAQGIIYESATEEFGVTMFDSVQKHLSYIRYMITTYTNLEYTDDDYDMICSVEYNEMSLLNVLMSHIGYDAHECKRILNFMVEDKLRETNAEFVISKFLNEITQSVKNLTDKLSQKTEELDPKKAIPDSVDMDKLGTFLQNYIK